MFKVWVFLLNVISSIEGRVADRFGEASSHFLHILFFWFLPIALVISPLNWLSILGLIVATFYIFLLIGDVLLSVFGHEQLEQKRGLLDIESVAEVKDEVVNAITKYMGAILSYATLYYALHKLIEGEAFSIESPSRCAYFDFLYYSLTTITTVGYGDIVPRVWICKLLACSEILFGVGFAILMFAILVSVYIDIQSRIIKR